MILTRSLRPWNGREMSTIEDLRQIVDSIPLLTTVVTRKDGDQEFYHTRCEYCGNIIDNGKCGEAAGRDMTVKVQGHDEDCLYKRALAATGRKF